jgi:pimeloyl-ACP methyl ester carboxylesterase
MDQKSRTLYAHNGDVQLHVEIYGEADTTKPVILCVHGWPELAYSWRHQIAYFINQGYAVATMDVRGYGQSSKPEDVEGYTLASLAGDVASVAKSISDEPVILFGHDWGAPICYATALRYPSQIRAVAGLSVPFTPYSEVALLDVLNTIYSDQFFYILYFQKAMLVESEVEADMASALRKIYFALSGDAPHNEWLKKKPKDAGLLDDLVIPDKFPDWMTETDLDIYVDAFNKGGFTGPISRYRALSFDEKLNMPLRQQKITQPGCFIAGSKDAVRNYVPGVDGFANAGVGFEDFRGATIIDGMGHWIQQEAPIETNKALENFLSSLA